MTSDSVLVKLLISFSVASSIVCYENVYDLLEQRNQKRYNEPQFRHHQSNYPGFLNYWDENRHLNFKGNPHVFTATRPYTSSFGNGYDNLGNGIPFAPFGRGRQEFWRSDERTFSDPAHNRRFGHRQNPYERYPNRREFYPPGHFQRPSLYEEESLRLNTNRRNELGSKGNFDVFKTHRYLEDNEGKNHKKTDSVFQKSHEGVVTDLVKKENTGEKSHVDQTGENKSSVRSNKVVKKGYSTKGFASHHHKDETGNSTTYFDESSDFGGQSDFRDFVDGFGNIRTSEQFNLRGDEKFYKENGGQTGNYGSDFSIENQKLKKDFSSSDRQFNEDLKFRKKEDDDVNLKKNYHYLSGEKFDFSQIPPESYY